MKKLALLCAVVLLCVPARADEFATTDSGKDVLLREDGTWTFVGPGKASEPAAPAWAFETIRETGMGAFAPGEDPESDCTKRKGEEAARLMIKYALLQRVMGLKLDAETAVQDAAARPADLAGLTKVVEGFRAVSTACDSTSCEVVAEFRLFGVYKYLKSRKLYFKD